jgi:hypothetical protein
VDGADLSNDTENVTRSRLLAAYRGYGQNTALFTGFPADVEWHVRAQYRPSPDEVRFRLRRSHDDFARLFLEDERLRAAVAHGGRGCEMCRNGTRSP